MSTKTYDLDLNSFGALYKPMSPEQCRAARAWLGWSQQDLAKRASVGISTVKDFENGSRHPIANNLNALRGALEAGGIQFDSDAAGKPIGIKSTATPNKPIVPKSTRSARSKT
jgi:transcriptional regulator with XRE-family HTH domain